MAASAPAHAVTVRDATREDMPVIHQMILELAAYEGVPQGPALTAADLEQDGFDSSPPWFSAFIAERVNDPAGNVSSRGEVEVLGYALVNRAYSSWTRRALYVEDLFVREGVRRGGVGGALMRAVCQRGARERATRIDWHVLANNEPAKAFYRRLGARDLFLSEGRNALRLDQEHIQRLAHGGPLLPLDYDGTAINIHHTHTQ